jgi:hypothetical protein
MAYFGGLPHYRMTKHKLNCNESQPSISNGRKTADHLDFLPGNNVEYTMKHQGFKSQTYINIFKYMVIQ